MNIKQNKIIAKDLKYKDVQLINSIGELLESARKQVVLGAEKDIILIEYALGGISNKLFVSWYKLYLPDKKELKQRLRYLLESKEGIR